MKFYLTLLIAALLTAGCAMSSKANQTAPAPDGFDTALANFQQHLNDCPYPAAHIMVFARSWNIPEFVIQAYVPKEVAFDKGKTTDSAGQ